MYSTERGVVIAGEIKLVERKARICINCNAEIESTITLCPQCSLDPKGEPDEETIAVVEKLVRTLRPTVRRWVDRGTRTVEGAMRDDYRQKYRRARKLKFESMLDRFLNDATDNYLSVSYTHLTLPTIYSV